MARKKINIVDMIENVEKMRHELMEKQDIKELIERLSQYEINAIRQKDFYAAANLRKEIGRLKRQLNASYKEDVNATYRVFQAMDDEEKVNRIVAYLSKKNSDKDVFRYTEELKNQQQTFQEQKKSEREKYFEQIDKLRSKTNIDSAYFPKSSSTIMAANIAEEPEEPYDDIKDFLIKKFFEYKRPILFSTGGLVYLLSLLMMPLYLWLLIGLGSALGFLLMKQPKEESVEIEPTVEPDDDFVEEIIEDDNEKIEDDDRIPEKLEEK